jgi:hypothetical protein
MFKISKEEKKIQFIYLLVLWILVSLLFCYVCFFNYPKSEIRSREIVIEQINRENKVLKSQLENLKYIDSLENKIRQYDPATSQATQAISIEFELKHLKKIYNAKKADSTYRVLNQVYEINYMQYQDKTAIANFKENISALNTSLSNCMIGFNNNETKLNLQKAISQGSNK